MKKYALAVFIAGIILFPGFSFAAQADSTINSVYKFWWNRNARADEISFHKSHNTSIQKLEDWVRSIRKNLNVRGRYHISNLEGQTVSTQQGINASDGGGKMYLIRNGQRHRVYDIPTALAFGLHWGDRISLPEDGMHLNYILKAFPEGAPLNLSDGPFFKYVKEMEFNGRMSVTEESAHINALLTHGQCLLTHAVGDVCTEWMSPGTSNQLTTLFDWSFLTKLHII